MVASSSGETGLRIVVRPAPPEPAVAGKVPASQR
jgi:hypothetical protein